MNFGGPPQRGQRPVPPQPPNPFFDGTRLGLEGTMFTTLAVAIPAAIHIAIAVNLGYAVRLDDIPQDPRALSIMGIVMVTILAVVAMAMVMFFMLAIPVMAYSMGLVAFMLRWVGKRRRKEKLTSAIIGAVLGLLVGLGTSALVMLLSSISPTAATYGAILRWPQILTVDGIILLWFTLNPLFNAIAGAQIGWRLGKLLEQLSQYYFFY